MCAVTLDSTDALAPAQVPYVPGSAFGQAEGALAALKGAVDDLRPAYRAALQQAVEARAALDAVGLAHPRIDDEIAQRWSALYTPDEPLGTVRSAQDGRILALVLLEELDAVVVDLGRDVVPQIGGSGADPAAGASAVGELSRRVENLAEVLRALRDTVVATLVAHDWKHDDVARLLDMTRPRVAQVVQEQFRDWSEPESTGTGDGGVGANFGDAASSIHLSALEHVLLNAMLLHYMDIDLKLRTTGRRTRPLTALREAFATALNQSLSALDDVDFTDAGAADTVASQLLQDGILNVELLGELLRAISDPGKALVLLVELAATNPWAYAAEYPSPEARTSVIAWAGDALRCTNIWDAIEPIPHHFKGLETLKVALGAAALASSVATAVPIPFVGPAVGKAVGMRSTKLAPLGGGSLAASGLGMAGGTALLGLIGARAGGAALSQHLKNRRRLLISKALAEAEKAKFVTLIRLLRQKGGRCADQADTLCAALERRITALEANEGEAPTDRARSKAVREQLEVLRDMRNNTGGAA